MTDAFPAPAQDLPGTPFTPTATRSSVIANRVQQSVSITGPTPDFRAVVAEAGSLPLESTILEPALPQKNPEATQMTAPSMRAEFPIGSEAPVKLPPPELAVDEISTEADFYNPDFQDTRQLQENSRRSSYDPDVTFPYGPRFSVAKAKNIVIERAPAPSRVRVCGWITASGLTAAATVWTLVAGNNAQDPDNRNATSAQALLFCSAAAAALFGGTLVHTVHQIFAGRTRNS